MRAKRLLLDRGLISLKDLQTAGSRVTPGRKTISAKEFLDAFQKRPDDFYLMHKFSLEPRHLKKLYTTLVAKELLSEYEYHARSPKAPELEDPDDGRHVVAASTVVNLHEGAPTAATGPRSSHVQPHGASASMFTDFSGVKLGQQEQADPVSRAGPASHGKTAKPPMTTTSTVVEVKDLGSCPKCGAPKQEWSRDSCANCGVVFAKLSKPRPSR
jgi:hypothetical protein